MPNITINHVSTRTEVVEDGNSIGWVTADATVTDIDDTHISVTVGGVPIITMDINDITSIDGAAPYGNAGDIVGQITNAASGTPTLAQVLTAGASAGAKITNLTDPTADQDAATKKYVDDNAGAGAIALESYQNTAMSAPVQAYVFRDESDNIYRVYEPVRNNDVSRSALAYNVSVDAFPFDNATVYNNLFRDVQLTAIAADVIIDNCTFTNLVIDGNSHTGLTLQANRWTGILGVGAASSADLNIVGNGVSIIGCSFGFRVYIDNVGASCGISRSTFGNGVNIDFNSTTSFSITDCTFADFSNVWFDLTYDAGQFYDVQVGNTSYVEVKATGVDIMASELGASVELYAGHDVTNCHIMTKGVITTAGAITGKTYLALAGTTYELGEDTGTATLTTP